MLWDLFVLEPWFLVEGVLFISAGAAAEITRARGRWTAGCVAAPGMATLTGLLACASEISRPHEERSERQVDQVQRNVVHHDVDPAVLVDDVVDGRAQRGPP